jgi:hypothetical protein
VTTYDDERNYDGTIEPDISLARTFIAALESYLSPP